MNKTSYYLMAIGMAVATVPVAPAAMMVHLYNFNGNYNDSVGSIPLVSNGGTLGAGYLDFGANQGPTLNMEAALAGNYTIAMRFSLADIGWWRKLVDFQNCSQDAGQYYAGGYRYLDFFPVAGGGGSITRNTMVDAVFTRNGANGTYAAYLNGSTTPVFSFADSGNIAVATVIGGMARLNFFQDDYQPGRPEASAGRVDEIAIWNGPLAPSEIPNAFASVPEPATWMSSLVVLGGVAGLVVRHRRMKTGA